MELAASTPASVQMNVRMDAELKQRGDAALQSLGFSPTKAVRALWSLACGGSKELDELKRMLDLGRSADSRADAAVDDAALREGWSLYGSALQQMGASGRACPTSLGPTDEELLEESLWERLEEKGLA